MSEEKTVFRIKTAPSLFIKCLTQEQWEALSDGEQDILVEAAKIVIKKGTYSNPFIR